MDDDPFEVTAKVVDSIKSSAKGDKKGISPDPQSSYVEQEESGTVTGHTTSEGRPGLTVSEQVDDMIDQSIEIESNKKMIRENVRWFPLTFTSKDMELKVYQREPYQNTENQNTEIQNTENHNTEINSPKSKQGNYRNFLIFD